jgi:hypothetical protein
MNKNLDTFYMYVLEQICMIVTSLETSVINDFNHLKVNNNYIYSSSSCLKDSG